MSVNYQIAEVGNILGLEKALSGFRTRAENGESFCLHFIAHGDEAGLAIGENQELVPWDKFRSELRSMNDAMSGQMIVNMTSCSGLFGVRIVDPDDPDLPFFGIVGPMQDLEVTDASRLSLEFYCLMHSGKNIAEIISLNKQSASSSLYFVPTVMYRDK